MKAEGYKPFEYYRLHSRLKQALDALADGTFSRGDRGLFQPLLRSLLDRDEYMLLADFPSYIECQSLVSEAWRDAERWSRMSILNTARSGKFSSDRSIRDYCHQVWHVEEAQVAPQTATVTG
jgi:starch phosphorylase